MPSGGRDCTSTSHATCGDVRVFKVLVMVWGSVMLLVVMKVAVILILVVVAEVVIRIVLLEIRLLHQDSDK